jgi:hypothetical protein
VRACKREQHHLSKRAPTLNKHLLDKEKFGSLLPPPASTYPSFVTLLSQLKSTLLHGRHSKPINSYQDAFLYSFFFVVPNWSGELYATPYSQPNRISNLLFIGHTPISLYKSILPKKSNYFLKNNSIFNSIISRQNKKKGKLLENTKWNGGITSSIDVVGS